MAFRLCVLLALPALGSLRYIGRGYCEDALGRVMTNYQKYGQSLDTCRQYCTSASGCVGLSYAAWLHRGSFGLCQLHGAASAPDATWAIHAEDSEAIEITRAQGQHESYQCWVQDSNLCAGVVCTASQQCKLAGACAAGQCPPETNAADGTVCDDGNAATTKDVCTAGACAGQVPTCTGAKCTGELWVSSCYIHGNDVVDASAANAATRKDCKGACDLNSRCKAAIFGDTCELKSVDDRSSCASSTTVSAYFKSSSSSGTTTTTTTTASATTTTTTTTTTASGGSGFTYTELSCADLTGTWDVTPAFNTDGVVTIAQAGGCAATAQAGGWAGTITIPDPDQTRTVAYTVSGSAVSIAGETTGTISGSPGQRTIEWANGFTYTERSGSSGDGTSSLRFASEKTPAPTTSVAGDAAGAALLVCIAGLILVALALVGVVFQAAKRPQAQMRNPREKRQLVHGYPPAHQWLEP